MNKLECRVNSCAHYQAGCCALPSIHVTGSGASVKSQTCCSSYQEKGAYPAQNAVRNAQSTQIHCDAHRCEYNAQGSCSAANVCVDGCCGTVSDKGETECSTFQCK